MAWLSWRRVWSRSRMSPSQMAIAMLTKRFNSVNNDSLTTVRLALSTVEANPSPNPDMRSHRSVSLGTLPGTWNRPATRSSES